MMRHRRALYAVATALLLALGCDSPEERLEEHLSRAEQYIEEGRTREALIELRGALQAAPSDARVNLRIAELLEREGKDPDAFFYYSEAYRLDPGLADAGLSLARYLASEDPERAESIVDEILERDPQNAHAHSMRSFLRLVSHDTDGALASALTAVELAPEDPAVHMQLGVVHQARIRELRLVKKEKVPEAVFRQAIEAFEQAAKHGEGATRVRALVERAKVLATWPGHQDEAIAAYREAVTTAREEESSGAVRAALTAAGEYARATRNRDFLRWTLEQRIALDSEDVGAWVALARLEQAGGGDGAAILRKLVADHPERASVHVAFARFLASQGDLDAAAAHLRDAAGQVDDPTEVLGFLVDLEVSAGRFDEAERVVEELVREHPDALRTQLARAQLAIALGRPDEAVEILQPLSGSVSDSEVHYLLALALARQGRPEEATAALDRAIELNGGPTLAHLSLQAQIRADARDWAGVLRSLRELRERRGADLDAPERALLVEAQLGMGRRRVARRMLEQELAAEHPPLTMVLLFAREFGDQEPERASALLEQALARRPGDPRLVRELARVQARSGDVQAAIARIDGALEGASDAQRVTLLAERARLRLLEGDLEGAARDTTEAFALAPGQTDLANLLVAIRKEQGRIGEAIAALEEADALAPLDAPTRVLLARLYLEAGREDDGVAALDRALEARSDLPSAKNDLAYLLAKRGEKLDRALRLAREAVSALGERHELLDTLGYVYLKKGLADAAVAQLERAVEQVEADSRAEPEQRAQYLYHLGLALDAAGRSQEAARAFERALAASARFPGAEDARRALEAARAAAAS